MTIEEIILTSLFLLIYFAPSLIAMNRKHCSGITLVNLFLGWTFLGWVAALVWAVSDPIIERKKT